MKRTPEIFEKIEAYLNKRLSQEDLTAFEKEMQANPELQAEVAKHQSLHEVLRDKDTLEFKEKLINIHQEIKNEKNSSTKSGLSNYIKIAATLVVLIGLGTLLWNIIGNNTQMQDLYEAYYEPFPIEDITRGETTNELQDILTLYSKGVYDEVIGKLEKLTITSNQEQLHLYLGNSYLNMDQVKKAISQFENIPKNSRLYEVSQWYVSLGYVRLDETDKVLSILDSIISYNGIYKDNALKLKEALTK